MSLIVDAVYPRSLDRIISDFSEYPETHPGVRLEFWTFDDEPDRREAERRLSAAGVDARIRSAYKPLVHHFLEDVEIAGLVRAEIVYPVYPGCAPDRFLLEAYPLSALLAGVDLRFVSFSDVCPAEVSASDVSPADKTRDEAGFTYAVRLERADGRVESFGVFAPNRVRQDHTGESVVTSSGWLRTFSPDGSRHDEPLWTEYEAIYSDALESVAAREWGATEPFFEVLSIRVSLPARDRALAPTDKVIGQEVLSLKEALHEELYFSILEFFQKMTGRPPSDRTIRPGQVVPEITDGRIPLLRMELRPLSPGEPDSYSVPGQSAPDDAVAGSAADREGIDAPGDLDRAGDPIAPARILAELGLIRGRSFSARSYAGRTIAGLYHPGNDAAVMISGGQHANETTGIVGALRAARELAKRPDSHFAVCPLENPDGYALHRMFCRENPWHMHHAARYTAMGNDLEYQTGDCQYEKAIRVEAQRLTDARLHINLHGYAAHEWTRPLSGYIPRGFPTWMLPHGFFLVLRHHADWSERAREFLDGLTLRLAGLPGLLDFTRAQLELYARYVRKPPFGIINGFPCDLSINETSSIPLRLITEYPDETIHGEAFIAGHNAQTEAVLAAYEVFQSMRAKF